MKAKFVKKYIWSILCLLFGLFMTVTLSICVFKGDYDAVVGIVFGAIYMLGGIIFLFFNQKAYLIIEDGHIKGKYHLFGKIDVPVSDVDFVSAQPDVLTVQLKNGKTHRILGIENSWKICSELRRQISCEVKESVDELIAALKKHESAKKKGIIYLCVGIAFMFINFLTTVLLTGARDFVDFSNIDWIIFSCFCFVEIITVAITFGIAAKFGKWISLIEESNYKIRKKVIETKELLPGKAIKVYVDEAYDTRITIFAYPNSDSVYYTMEHIDFNYSLKSNYKSGVCEKIEELLEWWGQTIHTIDISEKFAL